MAYSHKGDLEVSNRVRVTEATQIPKWLLNTQYYIDDIVQYQDLVFKCIVDNISATVFPAISWVDISVSGLVNQGDLEPFPGNLVQGIYHNDSTNNTFGKTIGDTGLVGDRVMITNQGIYGDIGSVTLNAGAGTINSAASYTIALGETDFLAAHFGSGNWGITSLPRGIGEEVTTIEVTPASDGELNFPVTTSWTNVPGMSVVVPKTGKYLTIVYGNVNVQSVGAYLDIRMFDGTGLDQIEGSLGRARHNVADGSGVLIGNAFIHDVIAGSTITLQAQSTSGNATLNWDSTNGRSLRFNMISLSKYIEIQE